MTWSVPRAIAVAVTLTASGCGTAGSTAAPTTTVETGVTAMEATPVTATDASATTAPAGPNDFTAVADALAGAKLRWANARIADYQLTVSEHRNYWSQGCTWTTVVAGGTVAGGTVTGVEVTPSPERGKCPEVDWTVAQLHDGIEQHLRDIDEFASPEFGQHTLEVNFNDVGVPTSIEFDLANGDDEESSLRVTFTALS